MNYIINFLAVILGYLMNGFYLLLDAIGTPYIWLCIVLFAITTRFLFLPSKIRSARKKKLSPVLDAEIADIKYRYLLQADATDVKKKMNREIRAVHKKYRVSRGSGCLTMILQLPVYFALYRVVVSPNLYVPKIEQAALDGEKLSHIHNFLGLNTGLSPLDLGIVAYVFPLLIGLLTLLPILKNSLLKQKVFKNQTKQKVFHGYTIVLFAFQVIMLTCFSFKLPLAISFYWLTNDIMNIALGYGIAKIMKHDKRSNEALANFRARSAKTDANQTPAEVVEAEFTEITETPVADQDRE